MSPSTVCFTESTKKPTLLLDRAFHHSAGCEKAAHGVHLLSVSREAFLSTNRSSAHRCEDQAGRRRWHKIRNDKNESCSDSLNPAHKFFQAKDWCFFLLMTELEPDRKAGDPKKKTRTDKVAKQKSRHLPPPERASQRQNRAE